MPVAVVIRKVSYDGAISSFVIDLYRRRLGLKRHFRGTLRKVPINAALHETILHIDQSDAGSTLRQNQICNKHVLGIFDDQSTVLGRKLMHG